jgi:large subunit ribosomal protein L35
MAKRKIKTKKSLAKRVKKTKSGKFIRKKAGKSHLLSGKSRKRKRTLKKDTEVGSAHQKTVKACLPYA